MLVWLLASALATPALGIHATGGVGQQAIGVEPWRGGGVTAFGPATPRLALGGRAEVGYVDRFSVALVPQARVQPLLTGSTELDLVAGVGLLAEQGIFPAVTLGASSAVPLGEAPARLRVEGTWLTTPGDGPTRFLLSVGLESFKRPQVAPEPEPVVDTPPLELFDDDEVADPTASTDLLIPIEQPPEPVSTDEAMVTIAWPECQTVPVSQAAQILATAPSDERVRVRVGDGVAVSRAAGSLAESLPEPVDQGALLVVAWPGDTVTVAQRTVTVADDGVAVVQLPADIHEVTVSGGGRSYTVEIAVAAEHATWLRAPEPTPVRFAFEVNRAELTRSDRQLLAAFGQNAGSWSFSVQGGYSPEGSLERNQELAKRRAAAAVKVLEEAGVPRSRIQVLDPEPPDPSLSPSLQRKTVVTPVKVAP